MSQNVKNQRSVELNLVAEVAKRLSSGGLTPADVQALLEKKPSGESSLDSKIVAEFCGFDFTEANFNETVIYSGQTMKRHRNGGGWVPAEQSQYDTAMPYVAPTVHVGASSMVSGFARVEGFVYLYGSSRVYDHARLYDYAYVHNSIVCGNSLLTGTTTVTGNSYVTDGFHGHDLKISGEICRSSK